MERLLADNLEELENALKLCLKGKHNKKMLQEQEMQLEEAISKGAKVSA